MNKQAELRIGSRAAVITRTIANPDLFSPNA